LIKKGEMPMSMTAQFSEAYFQKMMAQARANNARKTRDEHEVGFTSPQDCDLATHLRTVRGAMQCAVRCQDWQTACDGIALLDQAIARCITRAGAA
jgi:hypothetical protein